MTASVLACVLPLSSIPIKIGMTVPVEFMIGLLIGDAVSVRIVAVAYSCNVWFDDCRKLVSRWSAPASTILILFLPIRAKLILSDDGHYPILVV